MNKEEALQWLTNEKWTNANNKYKKEWNEAFEMAIEALSADAVPTVIRAKTFMRKEDFDKWAEDIKKQNKSIVCIPCDAEVVSAVQGEWIDRSNGGRIKYPWWESCECNQCGEYGSEAYNFCPNCGARMKGGDDE